MKSIFIGATGVLIVALSPGPAAAWSSANRFGGSTSHTYGATHATTAWGGSATHVAGQGTSVTGAYGNTATHAQGSGSTSFYGAQGGSATHTYGQGTTGTTAYGTTATHATGSGYTTYTNPYGASATAYRAPVPGYGYPAYPAYAYHPPVVVPAYSSGCYNCGGAAAAGAIVGMAVGAAVASSNTAAATSNAYSAGVAAGSASSTSAYSSGYAAGTANTIAAVAPAPGTAVVVTTTSATSYTMGVNYATLPAGAMAINKNGGTYYLSGNSWFQPAYGANGVYYRVVPTP